MAAPRAIPGPVMPGVRRTPGWLLGGVARVCPTPPVPGLPLIPYEVLLYASATVSVHVLPPDPSSFTATLVSVFHSTRTLTCRVCALALHAFRAEELTQLSGA